MDAVDEGLLRLVLLFALFTGHLADAFGHRAVGQQHEFLDELVGVLALLEIHGEGLALLVDLEAHLRAVEVHAARLEAFGAQDFGEAVQLAQLFGVVAVLAFEDFLHLFVAVAAVAARHRVGQMPVLHLAFFVDFKHDAVGQLVFVGAQRADEVAEPFGQHRHGAVHQIDARGALLRLAVDDAPFRHVGAHVGDVHAHFPQVFPDLADGERVVEVLGVARVDGEGEHLAHILPSVDLLLRDFQGDLLCGGLYGFGVGVGQTVFSQYGVHLGVVLSRGAQDVHHLADGVLGVFGPLHDFHHRLVAVLALLEVAAGDDDVGGQRAVFGEQIGVFLPHLQRADELLVGSLKDLNHAGLADVVLASGHHADAHPVALHGAHRVALCHEDGLSALIGQEGVLAVGFAVEFAVHHARDVVQLIAVAGRLAYVVLQEQILQDVGHQLPGRRGGQ